MHMYAYDYDYDYDYSVCTLQHLSFHPTYPSSTPPAKHTQHLSVLQLRPTQPRLVTSDPDSCSSAALSRAHEPTEFRLCSLWLGGRASTLLSSCDGLSHRVLESPFRRRLYFQAELRALALAEGVGEEKMKMSLTYRNFARRY